MNTFIQDLRDQISPSKNIQQSRALIAKENIEQSFDSLIASPHVEDLTIKNISNKSGYAIGSIYRYFKKIDHLFINQFLIRVDAARQEVFQLLSQHQPHQTVDDLITKMVDFSFAINLEKSKPYIRRMAIRYVLRNSNCPEKFDSIFDDMLPHLCQIIDDDTSGTFKKMDEYQLKLCFRAFRAAMASPFYSSDTLAGSELHYEAARYVGINLLKKEL
jgi:AcrR family transcriptional regulator